MNAQLVDVNELQMAAERLADPLPLQTTYAFQRYGELLLQWNTRINLTGLREWPEIQRRLLIESLALLPWVDRACAGREPCQVIDVGTGAGIPGIPLKLARPSLHITLVEATGKKVRFVEHVIQTFALRDIQAIHGRAEDLAHNPRHRGQYHLAVARALAHLATALELCLPFLQVGGLALFPKGEAVEQELRESSRALQILGGELVTIEPLPLSELSHTRSTLIVVRAVRPTPPAYPRKPGRPAKHPLR